MTEKKNKRKGLAFTLIFHTAILVLFALYGLTYPVPRPEQGILINFGNSEVGSGNVQPDTPQPSENNTPEPVSETQPTPTPPTEVSEQEVITAEEAPIEVEENPKTEPVEETPVEEKPVEEKPRELDNKLKETLKNAFNKSGGASEGDDSDEIGDKGKLDGSKSSKNYTGGGSGNGFSYNLGGREATFVPKIVDDSQDEGKVVVDIKVDRFGKVVSAVPGGRGSTTSSSHLFRKAKEAALKTKFTPNPSGPAEQRGQITFVFILE